MEPEIPTFDAYLDEWVTLLRTRVKPSTWASYRSMAETYIRPALGQLRLDQLTVRRLDVFYVELLTSGRRRGGGPLSRRTVAYVHAIVHKALADAVAVGLLDDNVASRATVPQLDPNADRVDAAVACWDEAQTRRYLDVVTGQPLADLWRVALGTGMRRGELLGLRWEDVDLAVPQLRVARALTVVEGTPRLLAPKTGRSRTLHLDDATAAAIDRQPRDRDATGMGLVFTREDGHPLTPQKVSDRWRAQWPKLDAHAIPRIKLHATRHVHATLLLARGVPIKVVSQRLGHASIQMTMDVYAHVLPAMDRDAAQAISAALDSPLPTP